LVEVENIQHISGSIKVGIFDKVHNYRAKSNPFVKARQTVKDSVAIFVFNDLPIGRYAVASYHDENNDDTLNTKKLGIPIEGIGFSGKFNSRIKPPDFNMASFRLKADTTIVVKLIYNKRNK
jgi:uncharacterized protein (DUF2141 family)